MSLKWKLGTRWIILWLRFYVEIFWQRSYRKVFHNVNLGKPCQTLFYVFDCRKALDLPTTDSKVACTQDVQLYNPQAATKAQTYQEPYNDLVRPWFTTCHGNVFTQFTQLFPINKKKKEKKLKVSLIMSK